MPELPEVETVRRALESVMEGKTVAAMETRRADLRWRFPERMAERVAGQNVARLRRRSKYILIDLCSETTWLVHLGMSGRLTISGDPTGRFVHQHPAAERHDHVVWNMQDGTRITFNDPRRFGAMDLFETRREESHPLLARLGPEPLGNRFDEDYLATTLKHRNTPIKSALLDQRVVAGLGNIYVCEALFRAGISPVRRAGRIAVRRLAGLVPVIREVLHEAIEAGGSSLRDYRQADGELGYFQHRFDVYGREDAPCRRDGCRGTVRRITQSGRSTFYCTQCQR